MVWKYQFFDEQSDDEENLLVGVLVSRRRDDGGGHAWAMWSVVNGQIVFKVNQITNLDLNDSQTHYQKTLNTRTSKNNIVQRRRERS